ncbi:hypothetical protein ACFL1M_02970 [Patescibacteria group bacterium]
MSRSSKKGIFGLLFGLIVGAITALFLSTDKKGDTKKPVKEGVGKAKKKIAEVDKKKVLDSIGKKSETASKVISKATKDLEKKLKVAKEKFDSVDKAKYTKAVNEVVSSLKKSGKATGKQLTDIKALLVEDYQKVAPKKAKKSKKKGK